MAKVNDNYSFRVSAEFSLRGRGAEERLRDRLIDAVGEKNFSMQIEGDVLHVQVNASQKIEEIYLSFSILEDVKNAFKAYDFSKHNR